MKEILEYAPIVLVVLYCIIHWHFAVTPTELEKKHREILDEVDKKLEKYVTIITFNLLTKKVDDIHDMMRDMYKVFTKGEK